MKASPEIKYLWFEPWHVNLAKAGDKYTAPTIERNHQAAVYRQLRGITLLLGGEIAAIIGVVPIQYGVGEVTMIPTNVFYKYAKTCIKEVRKIIDLCFETYYYKRLYAYALADQPSHCRFMEAVGFLRETNDLGIRQFGPDGETFHLYARLKDEL